MYIEVLKSKLHCVKVTEANLNYMGSITIDEDLMDAAGLIAGEKVEVVNNNNGERLETYVIKAMVKALGLGVNIVECPIVRDADGLAKSSRNVPQGRKQTIICIL